MAVAPAGTPAWLQLLPYGEYGIAYDFDFRHLTDPVPRGWEIGCTKPWYARVVRFITGHNMTRVQKSMYSGWGQPDIFYVMARHLLDLEPRGMFASTIQALQLYAVPQAPMYLTDAFQLGGFECPRPRGPTPADLDVAHVGHIPARAPPRPQLDEPEDFQPNERVDEAKLTEDERARIENGETLEDIRREQEEEQLASQSSQEEVEANLEYAPPNVVTISDLDRLERFDEAQDLFLIGVVRVALPVGGATAFNYNHRLARPGGTTEASVKRLHGVMRAVGLRRRRFAITLAVDEQNIANLNEIQGNKLNTRDPDSLLKLVRFKDNAEVVVIDGATRIAATRLYYSSERKSMGMEHPWLYAALYRKKDIFKPANVSIYESLASNVTQVHTEPNAAHIWNMARGYLQDRSYSTEDRRLLTRATVAKFPGCLSALMDEDYAPLVSRFLRLPGWKSLRSLRLITLMWASEGRDIFMTNMERMIAFCEDPSNFTFGQRETFHPEILDWKTFNVHTQSMLEWLQELRDYELQPDRDVGDFLFVPSMEINDRTLHNLGRVYNPENIDDIPYGLHMPDNSLRYGAQFVERMSEFYERWPFALWLTPRTVPLIAKELAMFNNLFKELGRWECPQYWAVSSGSKAKGEGSRPPCFAHLWAVPRTDELFQAYVDHFADDWNPFHYQNGMRDLRRQLEYVLFELHGASTNTRGELPISKRVLTDDLLPWLRYKLHGDADPDWKARRKTAVPETDVSRKYWPVIEQGLFFQAEGWEQNFGSGFGTSLARRVTLILRQHALADTFFPTLMKFRPWYDARKHFENFYLPADTTPYTVATTETYKIPKRFNSRGALSVPATFVVTGDEIYNFEKLPPHLEATRHGRVADIWQAINAHILPLFTTEEDQTVAGELFRKAAHSAVGKELIRASRAQGEAGDPPSDVTAVQIDDGLDASRATVLREAKRRRITRTL
ncbi:hypothetical protein CALCODRAFT_505914 [Calocera cornea HHB12733]|uniref:Uncharacterized protein n=1 Tax=Calocera cornea HHB12733 TaxID=1353952 RepID=A0A165JGH6_9BASI|nr:hypothetical protein CALCODRAFT_505914 [Calocera cornea HHB12733]